MYIDLSKGPRVARGVSEKQRPMAFEHNSSVRVLEDAGGHAMARLYFVECVFFMGGLVFFE
jgi:hypothetical protein